MRDRRRGRQPGGPILCCTAEILANLALREGKDAPVDAIIDRRVSLLRGQGARGRLASSASLARSAQFLLMSATLGADRVLRAVADQAHGRPTARCVTERPVPLDFEYRETALHDDDCRDLIRSRTLRPSISSALRSEPRPKRRKT